ncbi:MAG TPA: hypothetical protein VMV59_07010 [Candidatus Dormibacteraeota bacterium]|nr:hypothetical protein [Candidatus Dormibacteraeota bacterium]
MQTDLPQIFVGTEFVEPDASKLSPAALEKLSAIRAAYNVFREQERIVAACQDEITAALADVAAATKACAPYGEYGFHRLWTDTFGGGPHNARGIG